MQFPLINSQFLKPLLLAIAMGGCLTITAAIAQDESAQPQSQGEGAEHKRHHKKHMRAHRKAMHAEHMLKQADSNGDGQIDLNEFISHAEQRFASMDQNSDGFVTREEMHKSHKEMRERHKQAKKEARKAYKQSMQETE